MSKKASEMGAADFAALVLMEKKRREVQSRIQEIQDEDDEDSNDGDFGPIPTHDEIRELIENINTPLPI